MPIRILIADDHAVVRSGLRALLRADPDLEVVDEAKDGTETLRLVEMLHPDMVLLDITMPPENGIKTAKQLKEKHPELIVLFLTMHEDESLLHEALRAGGAGYVIKRADESEIIQAIHAVSHGDIYVHPAMTRALLHQPVTTEHRRGLQAVVLTRRELDVLRGRRIAGGGERQRVVPDRKRRGNLAGRIRGQSSDRCRCKSHLHARDGGTRQ